MATVVRNVAFGQWRGCLFLHVGAAALVICRLPGDRSWGLELFTDSRWFALRPFKFLTWRRA